MRSVAEHARSLIGTPFRHQGRSRQGLDCVGLVIYSLRAVGFPINDQRGYRIVPPRRMLRKAFEEHGLIEVAKQPVDGDVLLFWLRDKRLEIHCGVACGDGFVHVEDGRRVEFASLASGWGDQVAAVFRVRGGH
jgi:cell wall-associated NlpC family hydrolase